MHKVKAYAGNSRGPFYGWVIVLIAGLGIFFSGPGQTYGVSAVVNPLIETTGWSRALVSSLYSAGTLAAGLLIGFVGRAIDRVGHRVLFPAVALLFGFACLWMSFVRTPAMLVVGFMLIRLLGQGSMTLVSTTLVPQWFISLRGRALSLVALGGAASAALVPPLNTWLVLNWGWQGVWQLWAVLLGLAVAPLAWLLVRDRPEDLGLFPDNAAAVSDTAALDEAAWTLSQAIRTRTFWILLFCSAIPGMINTGMIFHHVSMLGQRGISAESASAVLSIAAVTQLPLTFAAGYLLDRVPVRYVLAGTLCGQFLMIMWMLLIDSPSLAWTYGVLRGVVGAFEQMLGGVLWANYYGRPSLGSIRGLSFTAMVIGTALGPLPFGLAYDLMGNYTGILVLMAIFPVLGFIGALLSPPPGRPA